MTRSDLIDLQLCVTQVRQLYVTAGLKGYRPIVPMHVQTAQAALDVLWEEQRQKERDERLASVVP